MPVMESNGNLYFYFRDRYFFLCANSTTRKEIFLHPLKVEETNRGIDANRMTA